MNQTLTNIKKKSTPNYFLVRLNYDGILIDLLSIGILSVSSAAVFKPPFIGIGNNIFNLISNASESKSTFPSVTTIHRQPSLQADFSTAVSVYSNFFPAD
jgi:hypothetical protein